MSPSIPILFALLLTLISGSAEGGRGTDPVALLRQTLRYWRKIYNTYHEEVTLGYCWADYLLQISGELSTNPSASLSATGDRSNTTAGATKSQRNPFPENVMADATLHRETLGGHLREKRSHAAAESTISEFMKDPNGHRIATEWKITGKPKRRMRNEAGQGVTASDARQGADKSGGDERIAAMTDSYAGRRRRVLASIARPEKLPRELSTSHCELLSDETSSQAVNPTSNPGDDDEVERGASRDHVEQEDTRRKVLRPATTDRRGPSVESAGRPRSFSLGAPRGRHRKSPRRFRFRHYPPARERNSGVSEPLSAPEGRGTRTSDPGGPEDSLNEDGSPSTPTSRSQRVGVVKLIDSQGNSSRDPTRPINSRTPRKRKRETLSRDSPLSPRGGVIESAGETVEKKPRPHSGLNEGDAGEQRRCRQSGGEEGSRPGRKVSPARRTIHPGGRGGSSSTGFERSRRQKPCENRSCSRTSDCRRRAPEETSSGTLLSSVKRSPKVHGDNNGNSTGSSAENSQTALESVEQRSLGWFGIRAVVIGVLRTLGMFVQVGRQIIDIVDSNAVLACTKEYLWIKLLRWIDT